MRRGRTLLVAAIALAIVPALRCSGYADANAADMRDGATSAQRSEVWRMSGRLKTPDGHAFDYAASFFRFAQARGPALYPATISLIDEATNRRMAERRTERDAPGLASASPGPLAVRVGNWSLAESTEANRARSFDLRIAFAGGTLRVHGVAAKPRVAFPDDAPDTFAYTSIESKASLTLGDERYELTGKSWLDHDTADAAAPPGSTRIGRFCVQLDDGREIVVETSQDAPGDLEDRRAYLVRRDGTLDTLAHSRYEFANHLDTTWLSTHTRVRYPDLWSLHVDGQTERLALEPVKFDQETVSSGDGDSFWDGAVDIYDVTPGSQGARLGSGFVTLAGYARLEGDR